MLARISQITMEQSSRRASWVKILVRIVMRPLNRPKTNLSLNILEIGLHLVGLAKGTVQFFGRLRVHVGQDTLQSDIPRGVQMRVNLDYPVPVLVELLLDLTVCTSLTVYLDDWIRLLIVVCVWKRRQLTASCVPNCCIVVS